MMNVRVPRTALFGALLLAYSCSSSSSVPAQEPVSELAPEDEATTPIQRGPPGSFIEIKPWEHTERCDDTDTYLVHESEFVDAWLTGDVEWYVFSPSYDTVVFRMSTGVCFSTRVQFLEEWNFGIQEFASRLDEILDSANRESDVETAQLRRILGAYDDRSDVWALAEELNNCAPFIRQVDAPFPYLECDPDAAETLTPFYDDGTCSTRAQFYWDSQFSGDRFQQIRVGDEIRFTLIRNDSSRVVGFACTQYDEQTLLEGRDEAWVELVLLIARGGGLPSAESPYVVEFCEQWEQFVGVTEPECPGEWPQYLEAHRAEIVWPEDVGDRWPMVLYPAPWELEEGVLYGDADGDHGYVRAEPLNGWLMGEFGIERSESTAIDDSDNMVGTVPDDAPTPNHDNDASNPTETEP